MSTTEDSFLRFQKLVCSSTFCVDMNESSFCGRAFPEMLKEFKESTKPPESVDMESRVFVTILYGIITLMSLVGNSLVIVTFALDKHMRSVTNVFILSLAIADLLVTFALVPFNLGMVFSSYWIFGRFACKLVPFFMTFSIASSSLTLCSIALDRYVAIVHPHILKGLQNPKPAGIFLAVIWIVSVLCSVPNVVFYDVKKVEFKCPVPEDKFACVWPKSKYKEPLQLWMTLITLFIIPLLLMSFAYTKVGYHLWIRKPVGIRRNSLENTVKKKKVIKMLVIVMLAFVICWSPIMILNAFVEIGNQANVSVSVIIYLKTYLQCLSLMNCCINPVIYTFMNKRFRDTFATYLFCRKNRVVPIDSKTDKINLKGEPQRHSLGGTMVPREC